ncbi:hypothetical protein BC343_19625 [Mucilaginibacter pedocola]|uniref:ER-bound oxygenase mpaB/mpaB'/Rubber oxygenase catalytic domain-containing protein n=2 Tax=Mucilaginibacter pedocola TaxID=1792845 RepID=A0A1S9P7K7_9SPHI|nr:hypothetical protein BC343_19625 [Mucilaginibacter pedocola]
MRQKPLDNSFMDSQRLLGDAEADRFVDEVLLNRANKQGLQAALSNMTDNNSLITFQNSYQGYGFIANAKKLPVWAEPRKMKQGAVFFSNHAEMIMSLLGLLSLPYCYNAANGAMVLYLSEKIRNDTTKRLFETALFVWDVMAPDAFSESGKGFSEILKVRIMHAAIRHHVLSNGKWDPKWGVPINQEDIAGTNLSFSLIVIRGLRLLGFTVSQEESEAFIHLWNVIGSLTGLRDELISENPKEAQKMDRLISARQFTASDHGVELTRSLTRHILSVNKTKATENDILGLMRYLLGKEISDQLGITAPDLPAYKISLIRTVNFFKSLVPAGDPVANYRMAYRSFLAQGTVVVKQKL